MFSFLFQFESVGEIHDFCYSMSTPTNKFSRLRVLRDGGSHQETVGPILSQMDVEALNGRDGRCWFLVFFGRLGDVGRFECQFNLVVFSV